VRPRARLASLLAALLAALVPGCASKLPQTPQFFTIDAPAPAASPSGTRVVSLRRADVAPPYGGASIVYRVGDHAIERDPYASLADPPSWMLSSAIRGYLQNADFVRGVVSPAERLTVDAAIEPVITDLAGDFTSPAEPAAVLAIQFRVLEAEPATGAMRAVLVKSYTRRMPIPQRAADAVVAGWNRALGEIMSEFVADLKGALPPP
jgi:ABC-type uncharacterized transport system auxiliary subunit